jgi:two-component system sensor histidine kinase RegB
LSLLTSQLAINAVWLTKLRWVAVAGQLLTIAIVAGPLGIKLPLGPLLALAGLTAATNAAFGVWTRRRLSAAAVLRPYEWHALLGGLMVLDLFVLTFMLELTGGPTNPFAIFYFVNLALGGVLLPARWAWLLVGMATVAFAIISYTHLPLAALQDTDRLTSFRELGRVPVVSGGMLIAFAACGSVIVSFTTWLTRELRRNQEARLRAEELRSRSEKFEALGTLAAGAAHELATPLSTIAVVAKELEHELNEHQVSPDVTADIKLIRTELDRCRAILDRMSTTAGRAAGEAPESLTAQQLLQEVLADLPDPSLVAVNFENGASEKRILAPHAALSQAVRALVQNGLDSRPGARVTIAVHANDLLGIDIHDRGPGMPEEVLARVGEPFFTTKQPGKGMGLGLFLARSVIERLGGRIAIHCRTGEGTTVHVTLPLDFRL